MAILKPLSDDELQGILSKAIDDATDFIDSEIAPSRLKAQRYFDGEVDIGHEAGRSSVVSTKARDTVRAIKPSLMRVFLSTAKPVEFVPRGVEDVAAAEQATEYISWKFNELSGFRLLSDVFHDALVKKVGILKCYYEDYSEAEIHTYTDLDEATYQVLVSDDEVEVLEHSELTEMKLDETGLEIEDRRHDVKVSRMKPMGDICVESIPPEEFFIDRHARSIDDFYVCGHRTELTVGDLVEMGFAFDDVADLGGLSDAADTMGQEDDERRGYSSKHDEDEHSADPSSKKVLVTEAYMKVDADGTGVPMLHRFICGGTGYKILDYMLCDDLPFAAFECDPEPHAFYGRSVVDLICEDQDAATSMLRGILDNVALTNTPRLGVVDTQVNMDDVLNNEIGAIIRMRQPGTIQAVDIPFTAGQTLPALQYLDQMVEQKTGVTRASMGLNNDALQSTTKAAVNNTIQAAAGQVETIARNFAEGGMRTLFRLMLKLMVKHQQQPVMMRLNNDFVPIDPKVWNATMDVSVNVGLGTGREEEKQMALQQALQIQQQVYTQAGASNGLVSLTNIRNTLADVLATAGIRNSERYFQPMTPESEQQLLAQVQQQQLQQQQQAAQNDPNRILLQAEAMKAQTKAQTDMARLQLDQQKFAADDDRKRDEMDQELLIKAAETLAKYGIAVDVAEIKARQSGLRQPGGDQAVVPMVRNQ